MIRSFRQKGLRRFYRSGSRAGMRPDHADRLQEILSALDAAAVASDMGYPTSGLHPLKGPLAEYWSVSVSGNWRVIFKFEGGEAFDVDYLDYH